MAQSSFTANTNDNEIFKDSTTSWAAARNAATADFLGSASATTHAVNNEKVVSTWRCKRYAIFFDTSSLPDGATITSATLNLRVTQIPTGLGRTLYVCPGSFTTGTLTTSDYSAFTFTNIGSVAWPTIAQDLAVTITDLSYISKTAETKFMLLCDLDFTNTDPGLNQYILTLASANNGTSADKPELVVDYSLGNKSQSYMLLGFTKG